MKRLTAPLLFIFVLSFCAQTADASSTTHTYFFSQPRVEVSNGVTAVVMDGAVTWGRVGHPLLPYAPVKLLLPPGEEAVSIRVEASDPTILGEGYRISHRLAPYPLSQGPVAEPTQPDMAIYSSDDPYPADMAGDLQTQFLSGHGIAYAAIFPVSSGNLQYAYRSRRILSGYSDTVSRGNLLCANKSLQKNLFRLKGILYALFLHS